MPPLLSSALFLFIIGLLCLRRTDHMHVFNARKDNWSMPYQLAILALVYITACCRALRIRSWITYDYIKSGSAMIVVGVLCMYHYTSPGSFTTNLPIILTFLFPLQRGFRWDARALYLSGLLLSPLCIIIHIPIYLQLTLHVSQFWSSYKAFTQGNMLKLPSHHDILRYNDWTNCRGWCKHILMTNIRFEAAILSQCIPHIDTVMIISSSAACVNGLALFGGIL